MSDAPTSYPFLWNVPQLNRVEWNGIAANSVAAGLHYGALGRNTGEVIGVFGDVAIKKNPGLGGYTSSVKVQTLDQMESQLEKLQPPKWPAAFGGIDTSASAGSPPPRTGCRSAAPDRADKLPKMKWYERLEAFADITIDRRALCPAE